MSIQDIRWKQRFQNFLKAFALLESAVAQRKAKGLSELEAQGLIQRFEFTHELAWNVLKDYLEYQGFTNITGSRDACREAFSIGLVQDGEGWMDMIKSRNLSTQTYDEATAQALVDMITMSYVDLFEALVEKMTTLLDN